jgi:cyclopropane-fatty-acyl-phospholipid synthase
MGNLNHISQFVPSFLTRGLLYAIAHDRIHSPLPLEADENWRFWTDPKPGWLEWLARAYPPEPIRQAYLEAMLTRPHDSGIAAHYDISNDFYALFLDTRYRFYSCAEFSNATDTLEEAQERKAQYIQSLLNLAGHESVLDLGCGWGAMLRFLRQSGHRGDLTGFTLSREQFAYIQTELGFNVALKNFITDGFDLPPCDRVLSIGAIEHVRPDELEVVYQKIYEALVPGGVAVHQFFSLNREPYPASMVMVQLFFPGSLLTLHSRHCEIAARVGFQITHDSIHDYKPTLRAWYERLVEHQEQALQLVDLEVYNRYMTFFPISWLFFQQQEADLHRMVMLKPKNE